MKKRLKITEGKAYILPVIKSEGVNISIKSHNLIGVGVEDSTNKDGNYLTAIIGNGKKTVVKANAELIADAFNTANETQLLPSELKEQRDELFKALNVANAMITHVGCVQGCNKGTTHDGEQCQWCDESSLIKNIIDKIKDNE